MKREKEGFMKVCIKLTKGKAALLAAAIALIVGILAGGMSVSASMTDDNLRNGGFEEGGEGTVVPGWSLMYNLQDPAVSYSVTTEKARTGSNSLKLSDTTSAHGVALWTDPIAIIPGETYSASAWMYIDGDSFVKDGTSVPNRGSFMMRFFDDEGVKVGNDFMITHYGQSQWTSVSTGDGVAPEGAVTARLFAYISNHYQTNGAYYDDIAIEGIFPGDVTPAAQSLSIDGMGLTSVNGTYTATLSASGASSLYAVDALIHYDPSQFQYASADAADEFRNGNEVYIAVQSTEPGKLRIVATQLGEHSVNGDTAIANIRFTALATADEAMITVDKQSSVAKENADATGVITTFPSDFIHTVQIHISLSDVNDNGVVDLADLIMVARAVGTPVADGSRRLDVNGDSVIDIADLSIISLEILEGEGE
ncbi:cohesin domain-containing protein [Paenibacillus chungangensis]|uniref:Cohesin domain-containing protein n=1 Tax=Paenibacillus chungangensis TaxID=696535 RepID=A0ABW3HPR8_9BACL